MADKQSSGSRTTLWFLYAFLILAGAFFTTYAILLHGGDGFFSQISYWSIAIFIFLAFIGWVIGRSVYVALLSGDTEVQNAASVGFGIGVVFALVGAVICLITLWPAGWAAALALFLIGTILGIVLLSRFLSVGGLVIVAILLSGVGAGLAVWLHSAGLI